MGFLDKVGKIISPYDDDDEFFEGAEQEAAPAPVAPAEAAKASRQEFEAKFAVPTSNFIEGEPDEPAPAKASVRQPGLLGKFGGKLGNYLREKDEEIEAVRAPVSNCAEELEGDSGVLQFSPSSFQEACELLGYLLQGKTVYLSLEKTSEEFGQRLMDFMTGITYAVEGKVTKVGNGAYFITPHK